MATGHGITTQGPMITLQCAVDLAPFTRVVINSSGKAAIAGAAENHDGVVWERGGNAGDYVEVRLRKASGTTTFLGNADNSINVGDLLYTAANGRVSATKRGGAIAKALGTGSGVDGEQIQAIEIDGDAELYTIEHVVNSSEDTANAFIFDTGFGAVPLGIVHAQVLAAQTDPTARAVRVPTSVAFLTGGNLGKISVADSALAVNEIISVSVRRTNK